MKIGFDAKRLFNNFTGLGNYSRTMVDYLQRTFPQHEYYLFSPTIQKNIRTCPFLNEDRFRVVSPQNRMLWRSKRIMREPTFQSLDIYHGLSHELPFGMQSFNGRKVVTIHDLIFKYYPQDYGVIDRTIYDVKFKASCKAADAIIAISNQTKNDIVKYYGIDPKKIHLIYQSCDQSFRQKISASALENVRSIYNLPSDYLLYVGSIISRKNLGGVIEAMNQLPQEIDIPLVIIGNGKSYKKEVLELIHKRKMDKRVIWLRPKFEDFAAIYSMSAALVLPSYYEGFGIPILEAMSVGTPVITSNQSSLAEVAGDAGSLVDPGSTSEIAQAVERILVDKAHARRLSERGLARSRAFDPVTIAGQVMDLYHSI